MIRTGPEHQQPECRVTPERSDFRTSSSQSAFPVRDAVGIERSPSVLPIETAGDVLETLTPRTARDIVSQLYVEPETASDIAESVDTSLQNTQYHLGQLRAAGLIDVVDTWCSAKGTEMNGYGPVAEPLVLCAGASDATDGIRQAVDRGTSCSLRWEVLSSSDPKPGHDSDNRH